MDHMLSSLSGFSSLASCKTCVSTSLFVCVHACMRVCVFGQVVGEVCVLMQMHRSHDVFALYVCRRNEDKST